MENEQEFELDFEKIKQLKQQAQDNFRAQAHVVDGDVIEAEEED